MSKNKIQKISDVTHHIGHNVVMHLHHDYDLVRREFSHLAHLTHLHGVGHNLSGSLGNVRHDLLLGSAAVLLLTVLSHNPASAAPVLIKVTDGAAAVWYSSVEQNGVRSASAFIDQTSQTAKIHWDSFNVAANERVTYRVPNAAAATLNVIHSTMKVSGTITSDGTLYFSSPNGMVFDATSRVTANNFYATTAYLSLTGAMPTEQSFSSSANPTSGGIELSGNMSIAGSLMVKADRVQVGNFSGTNTISASNINLKAESGMWVFQAKLNAQTADQSGGTVTLSTRVNDMYIDGGANIDASAKTANKDGGTIKINAGRSIFSQAALKVGGTTSSTAGVSLDTAANPASLRVGGITSSMAPDDSTVTLTAGGDIHVNLNDHIGAKAVNIAADGNVILNGQGSFASLRVVAGLDVQLGDWSNLNAGTAFISSKIGTIYQTGSSTFSADKLTAQAANGIRFTSAGNKILSLGNMGTKTGNIEVVTTTQLNVNNYISIGGGISLNAASFVFADGSGLNAYNGISLKGSTISSLNNGTVTLHSGLWALDFNGTFTNVGTLNLVTDIALTVDLSKYSGVGSLALKSIGNSVSLTGSTNHRFTALTVFTGTEFSQSAGSIIYADNFTINSNNGFTFNLSLAANVNNLTLNSKVGGVHLIGGLVTAPNHIKRLVINAGNVVDQDQTSAVIADFISVNAIGGINLSNSGNRFTTIGDLINRNSGNVFIYSAESSVNIGGTYTNTARTGQLVLGLVTGGIFNITGNVTMTADHITFKNNVEGGKAKNDFSSDGSTSFGFTINTNNFKLNIGDENGGGKFRNFFFTWNATDVIGFDVGQFRVRTMNLNGYTALNLSSSVVLQYEEDGYRHSSGYVIDLYLRNSVMVNGQYGAALGLYNVTAHYR